MVTSEDEKKPMESPDEEIRKELEAFEISFYTPREDSVGLDMVDDIIADGTFFRDIHEDSNEEELKKWLLERQKNRRVL